MRSPNSSKRARWERAPSYRLMVRAADCKRSHPSGGGISSMDTPRARRRSTAAARARCMGSSAGTPIQAARCRSASKRPPKPRDQSSAMSAAVAVKRPTVSSEGANGSAPSKGSRPKLGLKPQMPQNRKRGGGRSRGFGCRARRGPCRRRRRRRSPRNCLRGVAGESADCASPRGRRRRRRWFGSCRAGRRRCGGGADDGGVESAPLAARVERRAILGGESAGLEDVLDAERDAVQEAVGEGGLRRDFDPGLDVRFAGGDAAQADFQQVARRLLAGVQSLQEFKKHYRNQFWLAPGRTAMSWILLLSYG
jgi:hypothetical protein